MSKKNIALVSVLIVLGAIYVYYFTGLFNEPKIEIVYQYRLKPGRGKRGTGEYAATFSLSRKYELTDVKVIEEAEFKTNKYPHAVWHLITESNSIPTKVLIYSWPVQGMKPEIEKVRAEPLQTNVNYMLLLEAGNLKGRKTFKIR